ncbi:unnamed protein product [Camellia sinensis]
MQLDSLIIENYFRDLSVLIVYAALLFRSRHAAVVTVLFPKKNTKKCIAIRQSCCFFFFFFCVCVFPKFNKMNCFTLDSVSKLYCPNASLIIKLYLEISYDFV